MLPQMVPKDAISTAAAKTAHPIAMRAAALWRLRTAAYRAMPRR